MWSENGSGEKRNAPAVTTKKQEGDAVYLVGFEGYYKFLP